MSLMDIKDINQKVDDLRYSINKESTLLERYEVEERVLRISNNHYNSDDSNRYQEKTINILWELDYIQGKKDFEILVEKIQDMKEEISVNTSGSFSNKLELLLDLKLYEIKINTLEIEKNKLLPKHKKLDYPKFFRAPVSSYLYSSISLTSQAISVYFRTRLYADGLLYENNIINVPYTNDAINVNDNYFSIKNNLIKDPISNINSSYADKAHRDGVQLIPLSIYGSSLSNDRYAAGSLTGLSIMGNTIESSGKLQGIFSSDGFYEDLTISNNTINTNSAHGITINGMLSGEITNNNANVLLQPLRIGGNAGTGNLWVMSMEDYSYSQVTGNNINSNTDKRTLLPTGIGVCDLSIRDFKNLYESVSITMLSINNQINGLPRKINQLIYSMRYLYDHSLEGAELSLAQQKAIQQSVDTRSYYVNNVNIPIQYLKNTFLRSFYIHEIINILIHQNQLVTKINN